MKIHDHVSSHHSFMYLWILGALLVLGGLVYSYIGTHPAGVLDGKHEGDVRAVVSAFGNNLNNVSLLSPQAASDIERAYSPYVAPELLQIWLTDTTKAPGRSTSSPWPDHIEVDTVTMTDAGVYDVRGRIMLVTSTGDAGIIPVALTVTASDASYLITSYAQGVDIDAPKDIPVATSTVSAKLGETVSVLGIALTPQTLEEESRCPSDVTCIQAGTVRIGVRTEDSMGTSTTTMTLNGDALTLETRTITFTDAQPVPTKAGALNPEDYTFTFRIEPR